MQGVRDICFSNDGRQFLSTGYDKNIRLWDTETGTCLKTFNTGKASKLRVLLAEAGARHGRVLQGFRA